MKSVKLTQSNKGFTLVEIVVTLVIVSIVVSVVTFGLISWSEFSENNKMDDNAELVYMAAKNKLAILRANNSLDELSGWSRDFSTSPFNDNDEEDTGEAIEISGGTALMCNKSDYEYYKKKEYNKISDAARVLFDIISPYIYDKSILKACISIEFDTDRNITAVFYSDRYDSFVYDGSALGNYARLGGLRRNEEKRYKSVIGLYMPN